MALPLVVAGIAARAAAKKVAKKVATKAAKKSAEIKKLNPSGKTFKKIAQESKTNQVAKNSVKVKEADNIKRARSNVDSYYKTVKAKSGATAKEKAAEVTRSNKKLSPYKSPEVIRLSGVKPYKITGGAGSTARRTAEKAKKQKRKTESN
jgi:hypothetical protein